MPTEISTEIQVWPIDKLVFYARNPRKNDAAVDRMCGSIREFGFKIPERFREDLLRTRTRTGIGTGNSTSPN